MNKIEYLIEYCASTDCEKIDDHDCDLCMYNKGKIDMIDEFAKYIDKHSHITKDGCEIALDDDITILAENFKELNNGK